MPDSFNVTHRFLSFDGTPLFWRKRLPSGASKGDVLLVHGFSEHGGRYAHVAEFLAGRGYTMWSMDNRGHGRSGGQRGHVEKYDDYVQDLLLFHEEARKSGCGEKPFLLGHSNGGLIALRFALAHPEKIRGLVLSDPLLKLAKPIAPLKELAGRILVRFSSKISFPNDLIPEELTRDPAMQEAYLADPVIFHVVSVGWFQQMEKAGDDALHRSGDLRVPFLLLLGGDDPVCSGQASRDFFSRVRGEKELKVYEGFRHEIFNEVGRERVMKDLGDWLDRHSG